MGGVNTDNEYNGGMIRGIYKDNRVDNICCYEETTYRRKKFNDYGAHISLCGPALITERGVTRSLPTSALLSAELKNLLRYNAAGNLAGNKRPTCNWQNGFVPL